MRLLEAQKCSCRVWMTEQRKLGYRMREGQIQKVPYLLVIGFNEKDNRTVSYRLHGEKDTAVVGLDEFVEKIVDEIKNKVH
ncbi:MAG: His/Gly/Thr/Pro-type tRNA ligase C-terminal domain-containing protein [Coprococcus sp.]